MKALTIAHRGRHKEYFENTVGAFKTAAEGKYYGIETDIHLTKDNKWIIHHDADFLSNGIKHVIVDEKAEDLIKLPLDNEFGIKDAYCPMFQDYLDIISKSDKRPIIEIKPQNPSMHQLRMMIRMVRKYYSFKDFTIIAFYPWPLMKLRVMYGKKIHMQQLIGEQRTEQVLNIARALKIDIDIDEKILTRFMIDEVHNRGSKVNVWTVDDKKSLAKFETLGVDYITTNEFNQED